MQRYWSGVLIAFATTAVLGAQGSPRPVNSPPADAGAPAGRQSTTTAPSAQTKADKVTFTGCIQNAPPAGPAAGTTGATPAEKAAERAGNVPDPHEKAPAAAAQPPYFLSNATMTADGSKPDSIGTSGVAATNGYRLDGDKAAIAAHLNQKVRIVGTLVADPAPAAGAKPPASAPAAGHVLRIDSITMISESCEK